jgi:molybdate transport system ATP-binding protein
MRSIAKDGITKNTASQSRVGVAREVGALLDRRPRGLSGGERQRLMLARLICAAPCVAVLDEATVSLGGGGEGAW